MVKVSDHLDFNPHFLNHILLNCISDTNFANRVIRTVDPDLFKTKERKLIFKILSNYVKEYKEAPKDHFYDLFQEEKHRLSNKETKRCLELIKNLKEIHHSNPEYVLNKLGDAIYHFEYEEALIQASQLHKLKRYTEAQNVLNLVKRKQKNLKETYFDFFKDQSYIERRIKGQTYKMRTMIEPLDKIIGGLNPTWVIVILGATKAGKCVKYNSPIVLPDGSIKTISSIVKNKNKNILTLNQKSQKIEIGEISDFYDNGKKSCYKVITRTGREIEVTKNHPFLTPYGWKELKDINIGKFIAVPKIINVFGTEKGIPRYKLRLLAYLIADGGLTSKSITFTKSYADILDDFKSCVKKIGDKISQIGESISYNIVGKDKPGTKTKKWLKEIGLNNKLSRKKFIPKFIFKQTKSRIGHFLSALFTCDGSISKGENKIVISYSSSSKILIQQVNHLLIRFGIISKIRYKNKVDAYELMICEKRSVEIFMKEIGFLHWKQDKALKITQYLHNIKDGRSLIDIIPNSFLTLINGEIKKYINKKGKQTREWWNQTPLKCVKLAIKRGNNLSKKTVKEVGFIINSKKLIDLADSDILWDKIESVKYIGKHKTYDLTIPQTENFISSDMIIHNTKSLIELSVAGLIQGLNVLYITCEMNKSAIEDAFDQCMGFLGDRPYQEVDVMEWKNENWIKVKKVINTIYDLDLVERNRNIIKRQGGKLFISDQSSNRFNYMDMENLLDDIEENEGIIFDLVVTDYLQKMGPTGKDQAPKQRVAENCYGMERIAGERNQIHLTAGQGNRKAMRAKKFHSDLIADAIEPVWVASLVLAICQTVKEEEQNIYRFYIAESRYSEKHKEITLVKDPARGSMALGEGKRIIDDEEEEKDLSTEY